MKRVVKFLVKLLITMLFLAVAGILLIIIFAGDIVEYFIEESDYVVLGREIYIDDLNLNLFNGCVRIVNLRMMEADNEEIFVRLRDVDFEMKVWEAFQKEFHVEKMLIHGSGARLYNRLDTFNYSDIVERFKMASDTTNKASDTMKLAKLLEWNITVDTFSLDSCYFLYDNLTLGNRAYLDEINLTCGGISTRDPETDFDLELQFRSGGSVFLEADLDYSKMWYSAKLRCDSLGIVFLYPYAKEYIDLNSLDGLLNVDIDATGIYKGPNYWHGNLALSNFLATDHNSDSLVACRNLAFNVDSFNLETREIRLRQAKLDEGYLRFELYNDGDNWTQAMKIEESQVEVDTTTGEIVSIPGQEYFNVFVYIADYTSKLVKAYTNSNVRIDTLAVESGTIFFGDYTLRQEAKFLFEDLNLTGTNFDSRSEYVTFDMNSIVNKTGSFDATWRFDPQNVLEMELDYKVRNFLLSYFSPYSFHNTAYPLYHGDLLYEGFIYIHDREIESENHLHVEDIEVGKKVFDDPPFNVPLRLGVSLLRDLDGNIDLDLPVKGSIDDPEFSYWAIIWQVFKNIMVKAVTAPYRLLAGLFSVDESLLKEVRWLYGQKIPLKDQERSMNALSKVLKGKDDLALVYYKINNSEYEKDQVALFDAKLRYYLAANAEDHIATAEDTSKALGINTQDSLFIAYLKARTDTSELYSPTERARMLYGEDALAARVADIQRSRDSIFIARMTGEYDVEPFRLIPMPHDSLDPLHDTFNLVGPKYLITFDSAPEVTDTAGGEGANRTGSN